MDSVLTATKLSKVYRRGDSDTHALQEASISIRRGEAVALMGPSGCGKSTLLGVLGLMIRPSSGSLEVHGDVVDNDERRRANLRNEYFGYLHQDFAIIDDESVASNVVIPLEYAVPRVSKAERARRVSEVLAEVGLSWALTRRASRLSGGERQRVAIARSLVNNPTLLLADEPTAALDSVTAADLITTLLTVRGRGASVLLATHDPMVADRCDRIVRMVDGRLVEAT